jgi:hypothetical protein
MLGYWEQQQLRAQQRFFTGHFYSFQLYIGKQKGVAQEGGG